MHNDGHPYLKFINLCLDHSSTFIGLLVCRQALLFRNIKASVYIHLHCLNSRDLDMYSFRRLIRITFSLLDNGVFKPCFNYRFLDIFNNKQYQKKMQRQARIRKEYVR